MTPDHEQGAGDRYGNEQLDLQARFWRQTGRLPDGLCRMVLRRASRRRALAGIEGRVRCMPVFTPTREYRLPSSRYDPRVEDRKHHRQRQQKLPRNFDLSKRRLIYGSQEDEQ